MEKRRLFRKAGPCLLFGLFILLSIKYGGIEPGSYLGNRTEFVLGFGFIFLLILLFIVWPMFRGKRK
jgi:hypothetical protein